MSEKLKNHGRNLVISKPVLNSSAFFSKASTNTSPKLWMSRVGIYRKAGKKGCGSFSSLRVQPEMHLLNITIETGCAREVKSHAESRSLHSKEASFVQAKSIEKVGS